MHITATSTISHQPSFQQDHFSVLLSELKYPSALIAPDYSEFIPAMDRRRMSQVLKMAIACALDCLKQTGLKQPQAIIVGTGLGCGVNTKTFLDNIYKADGGLVSPTAFILSTHNSIAGQISLILKNQCYNITHTQNSLSFEHALLDAMLCIQNGDTHVLVGAADEEQGQLYHLNARLNRSDFEIASGASFLTLSTEGGQNQTINLVEVQTFGLTNNVSENISVFLSSKGLSPEDIDLVLYSNSIDHTCHTLIDIFGVRKLFDYQKITGIYLTNSAFAVCYGSNLLSQENHPLFGNSLRRVLVCNNLIPENLGLTLLEKKQLNS
ncbi:MAG TPA: 3-oxoacyl-ACP synthase [Saprospirales bacterium]|nr:3-oxoacyl-ACP synthase [Saprospirales bacterium]